MFAFFKLAPHPLPPLEGRWPEGPEGWEKVCKYIILLHPSVGKADNRLRAIRSAALTAHRAVIHYRRLRFAYPFEGSLWAVR